MKTKLILLCFIVIFFTCKQSELINIKLSGLVFGTSYTIIYHGDRNYEKEFDSLFYVINKSMSTYVKNSDISKWNRNESVALDQHFLKVFEVSKTIYENTDGMFDPTIGAIVNAWDFGPEGKVVNLDSLKIDSLMISVGLDKLDRVGANVVKSYPGTYLDFNAIAKGYAVDVIANFLDSKQIRDYLVEVGGEIQSKGVNQKSSKPWAVGIDWPNFDGSQSVLKAINLMDEAMATSGTYRKFKIDENGNRYAHIIDASSGYPSKTKVLSVSVIADSCMVADAYATAFQAMGVERVKGFLNSRPGIKVFFIFENEKKQLETLSLNGFPE
jgi:FAD:protein FMN transferase